MKQGVVTSHTTIGAFCNANLSTVEGCATIPLNRFPTCALMTVGKVDFSQSSCLSLVEISNLT